MTICETCKYAEVSYEPRTSKYGTVTVNQNGTVNIRCKNKNMSIDISGAEMKCSGYEPYNRLDNSISAEAVPVSFIKEKIEIYSGYCNDLYAAGVLAELVRDWKKEVMRNGEE